jgi:predicted nucleic acid-binding protein
MVYIRSCRAHLLRLHADALAQRNRLADALLAATAPAAGIDALAALPREALTVL